MQKNEIYSELGYNDFLNNTSEIEARYPEYADLKKLGIDKVYFSNERPTVLFVEVDSFSDSELRRIAVIQHKAWNYRKVILLFAVSDTEIRIYNCYAKPSYIDFKEDPDDKLRTVELIRYNTQSEETETKVLSALLEIFSRVGVDSGLLWTEQPQIREKVDLKNRLDAYLVKCLNATAEVLNKSIPDKKIIHGLLMRSLFVLFLEDKGAANEAGLYDKIKPGCCSYLDLLDDKEATYRLFNELQIHFNGNVTPILPNEEELVTENHLKVIKKCFIDGDISGDKKLFESWRLFDFEIIQIELLSEIYETFLGEFKHERGQFYTPYNLVQLILSDKLPVTGADFNVKVLDPACGSGIFLVESYKRLIKRWKKNNACQSISFEVLKALLLNNIYGIELDSTAIKVTAFSLYLALIDELDPKTLWIRTDYQLPYLIYDVDDKSLKHQGNNLWRRDTIGEVDAKDFPTVDLVVGNPPFGTKNLMPSIKEYCAHHHFAAESVLAFIHKSVSFCPVGEIALIFNSKVLTNGQKPYQNFRKWLFNSTTYVEKIYNLSIYRKAPEKFGGQLFSSATVPISIVYFTKDTPENASETITYWAPKTYIKSNVLDGVVIDNSDIKALPRVECQNPKSKIWKVALWGDFQDFRLLKRLQKKTLKDFFAESKWIYGRGLNGDRKRPDFIPEFILDAKCIDRYYTNFATAIKSNSQPYRRNNEKLFLPPFVLFKEGQNKTEIACSLFDVKCYSTAAAFVINGSDMSLDDKKFLVSYLNSDIAKYFLFLTTSTWGIERERVLLEELLELPSPFTPRCITELKHYVATAFDEIVSCKKEKQIDRQKIQNLELFILEKLMDCFSFTAKEQIILDDTLTLSLGLFKDGSKSIAVTRTKESENRIYATQLCKELNTFLGSSPTRVCATIYKVRSSNPLNLVVLHFGTDEKEVEIKAIEELGSQLQELDRYSLREKASSIYVRKHFRYYDKDAVYLIKSNQKRFWSRSQAMEDASSLISEIINMAD